MSTPGTVALPWCARCERSRFGIACIECGQQLEIETFVPLARAQRAEQVAWDLAKAARPYVENAAPHEQLFSGEDLRNFECLTAALAAFDAAATGALG